MSTSQPAALRWRRTPNALFLKRGKRALGVVFTRNDLRGFSWWAVGLGEATVAYATEEESIEALYAALKM